MTGIDCRQPDTCWLTDEILYLGPGRGQANPSLSSLYSKRQQSTLKVLKTLINTDFLMRPWQAGLVPVLCPCVPVLLTGNTRRESVNRGKVCLEGKVASDSYCVSLCLNTFQLLEFSYI